VRKLNFWRQKLLLLDTIISQLLSPVIVLGLFISTSYKALENDTPRSQKHSLIISQLLFSALVSSIMGRLVAGLFILTFRKDDIIGSLGFKDFQRGNKESLLGKGLDSTLHTWKKLVMASIPWREFFSL